MTTTIRLQRQAFDVAAEVDLLTRGRTDIGAVVTFTGLCRADENGEPIVALTLEHYPGMAEAEIARHVEEACARWPLIGVTVIHRHGRLVPGEVIVLVVTASSHREAAFAAASFLMDYLKTRAPFWKQVEKAGTTWGRQNLGRRQGVRRCGCGALVGASGAASRGREVNCPRSVASCSSCSVQETTNPAQEAGSLV